MTAFGPFTVSDSPSLLPLAGDRPPVTSYLVYLPAGGEIRGDLREDGMFPVVGTFDLRENAQDICFRLNHTGYPRATRTDAVCVNAAVLKRAIGPVVR